MIIIPILLGDPSDKIFSRTIATHRQQSGNKGCSWGGEEFNVVIEGVR